MNCAQEKGAIAEHKFCVQAIDRGMAVSRPIIDKWGYDFLIENQNHQILKIQVKYSDFIRKVGKNQYQVFTIANTPSHIDFFALYSVHKSIFYIIPRSLLGSSEKMHLRLDNQGKWEMFRDAFYLMS